MLNAVGDTPNGPLPTDFAGAVVQLLDEFEAADFRSAERILEALQRQGRTAAGFPRVRASDCDRVTRAIRAAFDANRPLFVTGDDVVIRRFDTILDAFARTDIGFYPREVMRVRVLQAQARLLLNDPEGARQLIGHYADRPYIIEGDQGDIAEVMHLDCRARAMAADVEGLSRIAIWRVLLLARLKPGRARRVLSDFAEFVSLGERPSWRDGIFTRFLHDAARRVTRARRGSGTFLRRIWRKATEWTSLSVASFFLFLLRRGDIRWRHSGREDKRDIIVTRAMGGIGDLFMMTPGLRALAEHYSRRVKLVVDRKYFGIFEGNPHVELIDIDGPPVDVANCRVWFNLTVCPAGRYETLTRPAVKKGRVELFAAGMGISRSRLLHHGEHIEAFLSDEKIAFRDNFLARAGIGLQRPLIGVQPYSRDSYKDHPRIAEIIKALGERFDIVVFHHTGEGLPHGPNIVSTAGLALGQSISLVSALDVMVCVDSGFLHAAAAFDVPVVALFGPTDGQLFTRHHAEATVLAPLERFPCAPCWRNEDLPCQVTNQVGPSPCVASISVAEIMMAVDMVLAEQSTVAKARRR